MKNIVKSSLFMFCLTFTVWGCKQDQLDLYSTDESGSSIFFLNPYNTGFSTSQKLDTAYVYSFGYAPKNVNERKFNIAIKVTGEPSPFDREFLVSVTPSSSLKLGEHFVINNEKLVIPAGKNDTTLSITVFRKPDLQEEPLTATLQLKANESFNTNFKVRTNTNKTQSINILEYKLIFDDILGPPYAWTVTPYKTNFDNYLGTYSKAKLQLLVDLFDIDTKYFTDESYAKANYFSVGLLSYWGSYCKYWLGKEAMEGRFYYDEYEKVITMGPRSN